MNGWPASQELANERQIHRESLAYFDQLDWRRIRFAYATSLAAPSRVVGGLVP
jgi:hypothetical protein